NWQNTLSSSPAQNRQAFCVFSVAAGSSSIRRSVSNSNAWFGQQKRRHARTAAHQQMDPARATPASVDRPVVDIDSDQPRRSIGRKMNGFDSSILPLPFEKAVGVG